MDPDTGADTQKAVSLQWKSYKLVQDPATRRVTQKIYRYDGVHFSVPDSGFPPVGDLRDPRPRRLWSRCKEMSLPVPKFKLDEFYVGPIPLKEVTFARLNDNIKEPFLAEMCAKFGEVEEMEILFHPKTRKHLGLARVLFTSTRGAKDTVKHLHNTTVMGNLIHAQLDIKGQQRQKYYDLIVNGSYTPQTVPLGGKALSDQTRVQPPAPAQTQPDTSSEIRRRLSSELAVLAAGVQALTAGNLPPAPPSDPGFSEPRLDTPGSASSSQGRTGTPHSSRSGTPFSQDSGYAENRHSNYSSSSGYPPQDMLPSSSSSSAVSSTVGGYKVSRYPDDLQDSSVHYRGRPIYPPTSGYRPNEPPCYPPPYPNMSGPHMSHHSGMPPPPHQYEQDREREGRYGAPGSVSSRRSSYHHQDSNSSSSSKYSHHSHHHREERGYSRRDSTGSRSGDHGRHHRNHHHSHNHSSGGGRRRSSHDRDRDRERDSEYSNNDPRYNSHRSSSNSLSPPPSAYKDSTPTQDSRLGQCTERVAPAPPPSSTAEKDHHHALPQNPPAPPPPPPPLPPASVIAAAVAESLDFTQVQVQESPKEQWTKPKRRPSTPPIPPKTPPLNKTPPPPAISSSATSPTSTSLPLPLLASSPPRPRDSSPEPDSTNESLPFVYHSSSLDSRIEMLLKEQKAKFSFLASDEEDEDGQRRDGERKVGEGEQSQGGEGGEKERRRGERGRKRGKGGGGEGRKSPNVLQTAMPPSSSSHPEPAPPPEENQASLPGSTAPEEDSSQATAVDSLPRSGAHTPPYNGQSQPSPHSSGEDMEISDEEEGETTSISTPHTAPPPGSSPSSAQPSSASQTVHPTDGSSSPPPDSSSSQHYSGSMHPPMPSYPPHLPPPPPPGYSLQPPPPPGIPPLAHMELHPEYPPPMPPPHLYDYASSMELMSQYSGGAPMSFQMQTHMLSRLHQMRVAASSATPGLTPGPGEGATADYSSYHLHSMPPPPFMEQEGSSSHYDQDHRYMPPHVPYPYHPDPHSSQLPPPPVPPPHGLPPHSWPPLPPHFPFMPPPGYGTVLPASQEGGAGEGSEYRGVPGEDAHPLAENPHEATVQLVLASLIQEMKNIMQRDLNRKMVENVAFNTFDEWWERKETKAKPFQTMVRGVSALRDEEKKEEKLSRPREPLMSLVDWAKSGGVEGFSLRGALRLPSFKVKRKEPQELQEGDMKRPRPQTPPEDPVERRRAEERHAAERDNKRRKKKPRNRKPWELDSEGEETSDGSDEDKDEEESEKDSDDEALSADSDDESLSSSSGSSSGSSSSESDEEEGERLDTDPDTMDESTMDSTADRSKMALVGTSLDVRTGEARPIKPEPPSTTSDSASKRPPSPPFPRPSSPVILVPPLKKRRKNVSFSTDDFDPKPALPAVPLSTSVPEPCPPSPARSLDTPSSVTSGKPAHGIQLLPFASKPGSGNALILPPAHEHEDYKKGLPISPPPAKSPNKRSKDSPKSPIITPPPIMVCRTVQNLPLDHASMCKLAYEEVPAPLPPSSKRGKGRHRTTSQSNLHPFREEDEDESRLRGASSLLQLAATPTADLSVLADVALKMDPDAGDSEETETSDEAEEHKMEDPYCPEALAVSMSPEGVLVFIEHSYCKPPHTAPYLRRTSKQESVLLPADLNTISGVLEAPEEVIEDAERDVADYTAQILAEEERHGQAKKKGRKSGFEQEKERNRKRRRDKENVEHTKKRKEPQSKKQRKRKPEDSDLEEDVDVEELESGELSSSSDSGEELVRRGGEEVRKSERLFLQDAGISKHTDLPCPPVPAPLKFENRSEFEQMTILYDIWNSGLDGEDLGLLRKTYEKLLQDDHGSDWLNDTHWVGHTVTNLPTPRRKKKAPDSTLREHVTGCARSEGYYAISRTEKDVYLDLDLPEQVIREVENTDTTGTNRVLSERRSEQRRLLTVIGTPATMDSDLLKLNQLKFRKKKLRFGRSRIHEWGLFAMEPIAADEMVIEYVGQNIRQMVADNREKRYAQQGIGSSYLFRVDHDTIIDATKCGNLARFINHCCTPNCYAKVITIESQKKIVIYSKQPIAVNEEITYDYKFPLEENKIPCLCGTENCRGTLN
ncbi:histone-lysine N-methyltransferase SETD1A [Periophthalmus magnuspinnatus]|uniref:histone-lysine N-methyltransferase SETD1A n=1 Tax=Periophthalmus magnuspinnatus TaxID=409849 RepID=UPI00243654EC|nr:histone-lysine N-methyltransferase SETD1A [Periophthalmus magnuspinnatus]